MMTEDHHHREDDDDEEVVRGSESRQEEEALSSLTMEKVAAAKKFIENHYRAQMKNIKERKESDANLKRDEYLRSQRDEDGWVPITVIALFSRVSLSLLDGI